MTERPSNEEREALIAGDRAGELEPDEAAELELLADLLADQSTWAEPPPGLEDMIVRAVSDAEPASIRAVPPARSAEPAAVPAAPARRRRLWSALAAAAAILIVVGTVAVVRNNTNPEFNAQLTATPLAPGARASADIERNDAGFRVVLDAHGLPALKNGEYYQAWLKNAAGTLVPIGTFSSSDAKVTLWSGVSPAEFPTITVTIESVDNVQASSGRRVLVGPVRGR